MLQCQKDRFSLEPDIHYLNCAYMGPLSRQVEAAGITGIRQKTSPQGIGARDFFADSDRLRELFGRLVHADPSRVAIIPAVSYGMAIIAHNTRLERGQNIVVVEEQFPSHVYPWRRLCQQAGAELRTVAAPDSVHRGEEWNAAVLGAIDADTALVALPHVHWTDGTRFDLERISAHARARGAALVIDGSQSVGALPFDVADLQPDALVCAGYKWLLGPYSIGLAYLGPRYDDAVPLEETWIGRRGSDDFQGLVMYRDEYQPGAARFDVGERSNFILVPMLVAAIEQVLTWQPGEIQTYCAALMEDVIAEARSLGFTVERAEWRGAHLFGLRTPAGLDLQELQAALVRGRVSASLRGSALRVSPNVYNDAADAQALARALRQVRAAV